MSDAVFISDLHLHPDDAAIDLRFRAFIDWAVVHTKAVYILGDLFHACDGSEGDDAWTQSIAILFQRLSSLGIAVYYLPGNRDFLIKPAFLKQAGLNLLTDPYTLTLNQEPVLLTHGDQYCTHDKGHMWLRWVTRNAWFVGLFLHLPARLKKRLVQGVRHRSATQSGKSAYQLAIVTDVMLQEMKQFEVKKVIHGHIHQPGTHEFYENFTQYVLSDWDENPKILCYDLSKGFYFVQMNEFEGNDNGNNR